MASYIVEQRIQIIKLYYQKECSLENHNFGRKIIFSDVAHFWMNGYVNKQN